MQRRIGECDPSCHISVATQPMSRAFVLTKINCSGRVGHLSQIITAAPQTLHIMARAGAMSALPAGAVPVVKFGFDDRDRSVQPSNDAKSTALGPDDDSIESGW